MIYDEQQMRMGHHQSLNYGTYHPTHASYTHHHHQGHMPHHAHHAHHGHHGYGWPHNWQMNHASHGTHHHGHMSHHASHGSHFHSQPQLTQPIMPLPGHVGGQMMPQPRPEQMPGNFTPITPLPGNVGSSSVPVAHPTHTSSAASSERYEAQPTNWPAADPSNY